jgi:hypothetical protein
MLDLHGREFLTSREQPSAPAPTLGKAETSHGPACG